MGADAVTIRNHWRQTLLRDDHGVPGLGQGGGETVWDVEQTNVSGSVRLRSPGGGYLHLENDASHPEIGDVGRGWQSAMWVLEPVPGTDLVRIRNLWRKTYLNNEHGAVESGEVGPGWLSARWKVSEVSVAPPPSPARGMTAIPLGGNAYLSNYGAGGARITDDGLTDWTDSSVVATTYVRTLSPGQRKVALIARSTSPARIEIQVGNERIKGTIEGRDWARYTVGTFQLGEGYVPVAVRGLEKQGARFPDIRTVEIEGGPDDFRYVSEAFKGPGGKSGFYFGRRGPSTHLKYAFPDKVDVEWFYSEITVPRGNDVPGSYFEANGSAESYFGMQVLPDDGRIFLFSVWASYNVDNPKDVPVNQRISLEAKGDGVRAGDFGGEGAGGSSSVPFSWKPDLPYGFLTRIHPNSDGTTSYSSWFHDPERDQWHFLASFRRPQTNTWYKFPYAFLENFKPESGARNRRAYYGNQWARDRQGNWHEVTTAKFTVDATAKAEVRMDFQGGSSQDRFFLNGFGFFDDYTTPNANLTRNPTNRPPAIDFGALPWGQ